jgi:hypothetical protein
MATLTSPISLAIAVLLAGCASIADNAFELTIPDALRPAMATHLRQGNGAAEALSYNEKWTYDHKLGTRPAYADEQVVLERQADGLFVSSAHVSMSPASADSASGLSKSVTVCGLVPVLVESASAMNAQFTTAVGGAPFGFSSSTQASTRLRLSKLSASSDFCSPKLGSEFTIHAESQYQRKSKTSIFSGNIQRTLVEDTTCTVASEYGDGKSLHPAIKGDYVSVSCRTEGGLRDPRSTRYAYLVDMGVYALLEEVTDWQTGKASFQTVQYKAR